MPPPPIHFFPQSATWPFDNKSSGIKVVYDVLSKDVPGGRMIELKPEGPHEFRAFFDLMTVTPTDLQLNRIRLQGLTFDIKPPLVITPDQRPNHLDNLLPGATFTVALLQPPYDGSVPEKKFIDVPAQGPGGPDTLWSIRIVSRARAGILMRPRFLLSRKYGLIAYVEEFYGVWELAFRSDLPPSPSKTLAEKWFGEGP